MKIWTVHQYQEYDDTDWSSAKGFVTSFDNAFRWAKGFVDMDMLRMNVVGQELGYIHQLIETQDQFKYFENKVGSTWRMWEGRDKVKFPVILPANASEETDEFEIIYFIGVEGKYGEYVEVRRWKFCLQDELVPTVVKI